MAFWRRLRTATSTQHQAPLLHAPLEQLLQEGAVVAGGGLGRQQPACGGLGGRRSASGASESWRAERRQVVEGWGRPVAAERAPRDIGCPAPTPPRIREMERAARGRRRRWGCGRWRRRRLRVAGGAGGEWWARAAAWRFLGGTEIWLVSVELRARGSET
jgi:hypothetical protein